MAPLSSIASTALVFAAAANAHFNLNAPTSSGFDEDKEGTAPCGSFNPSFTDASTVNQFHVGGEFVAIKLGHPQANWLYRATLDTTASGNWTQLFPIVQQSGAGNFCEKQITAPAAWVGQQGVLSVVANAPDGLLYQCSAVTFVTGTATPGSACTNATLTAAFVSDSALSALVSGSSSSSGGTSNGTSTTTSTASGTSSTSAATTSSAKNAAPTASPRSAVLGAIMGLVALVFL